MSSESFCLAAKASFDSKWLKTDLQVRSFIVVLDCDLSSADQGCF